MGSSVTSVTIDAAADTGEVLLACAPTDPVVDLYWRLAGQVGETLAFGYGDLGRSDAARADQAAFAAVDWDALDAFTADTRRAVSDLLFQHWNRVERLALALLEGPGKLSAGEVRRLLDFAPAVALWRVSDAPTP